jgi:hypothetical protein
MYQGKNPVNGTHDRFFSNKCTYVREYTNSISFVNINDILRHEILCYN